MSVALKLRNVLSLIFPVGRGKAPSSERLEPSMSPTSIQDEIAGLNPVDLARFKMEVANATAFDRLFAAAHATHGFSVRTMTIRLQLMGQSAQDATFKDVYTKARIGLDLVNGNVELLGEAWTAELMADFAAETSQTDDMLTAMQRRHETVHTCVWFKRHLSELKRIFRIHRSVGGSTCLISDMRPSILDLLSRDATAAEIDELGSACEAESLADGIATCLDYCMHLEQVSAYREHPTYAYALFQARQLRGTGSVEERSLAAVRLQGWAAEAEQSAVCPNTRAYGVAMEDAAEAAPA